MSAPTTSDDAAQADLPSSGPWPLTPAQTGLWYAQQLDPGNPSFNTGHALWLQGPLDVAAFAEAANQAAHEAQALCLRFGLRADGQGVQQWLESAHVPELEIIDLRTCSKPLRGEHSSGLGRSAALQNLPIARAIGGALRLASDPKPLAAHSRRDFEQVPSAQPSPSQTARQIEQLEKLAQEAMQADMARPLDPTRDRLAC